MRKSQRIPCLTCPTAFIREKLVVVLLLRVDNLSLYRLSISNVLIRHMHRDNRLIGLNVVCDLPRCFKNKSLLVLAGLNIRTRYYDKIVRSRARYKKDSSVLQSGNIVLSENPAISRDQSRITTPRLSTKKKSSSPCHGWLPCGLQPYRAHYLSGSVNRAVFVRIRR